MGRIGIMQGRLVPPEGGRFQSFPRAAWREEFPNARAAGLDAIEWIYDEYGESINPIRDDNGLAEMKLLGTSNDVAVVSLCADYFMDRPFVGADAVGFAEIERRLAWLIARCGVAGIERIVLPFVDASSMKTDRDKSRVLELLERIIPDAERCAVEIHLETDLSPPEFADFLGRCRHGLVWVNYDSGNSSSLGYRPDDEFAAYGERIGSVHIKDRLLGGSTVPLGTGSADLEAVFEGLRNLNYRGDFVLQAARGEAGDEVHLAKRNVDFVLNRLAQSGFVEQRA